MATKSLWDFLAYWPKYESGQNLREGQRFFNCLSDFDEQLANRLLSTDSDPFYDDTRIPKAIEFVVTNWLHLEADRCKGCGQSPDLPCLEGCEGEPNPDDFEMF